MSFNQRWRSFKTTADEQATKTRHAIANLPPVQAIANALHILQHRLEPLYKVLRLLRARWDAQVNKYAEFGGEETKRQWEWKRRTESERSLWVSIGRFVYVALLTVLWEAITPVSLVLAGLAPLFLAWIMYDKPLLSPIVVALVLMSPLKFPLGYPVKILF